LNKDNKDVSFALLEHLAGKSFDDLPREVVERVKISVLDTLGAVIAGSTAPGFVESKEVVKKWASKGRSAVLCSSMRLPAGDAAFLNGVMGRARDIDDVHDATSDHPGLPTVLAGIAMAEEIGGISGKELITAIALGTDIVLRIRLAIDQGPWTTGTFAPFAACAVAGKLMGLNQEKLHNAMGNAFAQISNTRQGHREGALIVRVHNGLAIRAGIISAQLAEQGVTGPKRFLEGEMGLYHAFYQGQYNREKVLFKLGSHYEGLNVNVKIYPCCAYTHRPISGAIDLMEENEINEADIEKIEVYVTKNAYLTVCDPLERKQKPENVVDAQFSIPYTVANGILKRDVFIGDFLPETIRRPEVIAIAQKVYPVINSDLSPDVVIGPVLIKFFLKDGRVLVKEVRQVKGSPEDPVSMKECIEKFRKCLEYSAVPWAEEETRYLIDKVKSLEQEKDIRNLLPNFKDFSL